jgi:hypothetical protein
VDEFAGGDRRSVADNRHKVALPPNLHLQDGETAPGSPSPATR